MPKKAYIPDESKGDKPPKRSIKKPRGKPVVKKKKKKKKKRSKPKTGLRKMFRRY